MHDELAKLQDCINSNPFAVTSNGKMMRPLILMIVHIRLRICTFVTPMSVKYWQIIRDDQRRTFEVCGQTTNENSFTNKTHAMQKAGMNVTCMTPPVTNKTASKESIKIVGYSKEDGLYERLLAQYRDITIRASGEWE